MFPDYQHDFLARWNHLEVKIKEKIEACPRLKKSFNIDDADGEFTLLVTLAKIEQQLLLHFPKNYQSK